MVSSAIDNNGSMCHRVVKMSLRASLLAELSDLFVREAFEKDRLGQSVESERLWEISEEIHERRVNAERVEAGRPVR